MPAHASEGKKCNDPKYAILLTNNLNKWPGLQQKLLTEFQGYDPLTNTEKSKGIMMYMY